MDFLIIHNIFGSNDIMLLCFLFLNQITDEYKWLKSRTYHKQTTRTIPSYRLLFIDIMNKNVIDFYIKVGFGKEAMWFLSK